MVLLVAAGEQEEICQSCRSHIWRQRFEGGAPQQVTFGPVGEEGIAMAPDGRSLITSVGESQSELWIHDGSGERRISSRGFAASPRPSLDGKRVYYLSVTGGDMDPGSELWMVDAATGQNERFLPGIRMGAYDISKDEKQVVYAASHNSAVWLAPLSGRTPPQRLSQGDNDSPVFGPGGEIYFMASDGRLYYINRMDQDGSHRQKVSPYPILDFLDISPDGKFAAAVGHGGVHLYPTDGQPPVKICDQCRLGWSADGKYLYLSMLLWGGGQPRTFLVPVQGVAQDAWLQFAAKLAANPAALKGVRVIENAGVVPGTDPDAYIFLKRGSHRNLYRIPLP